VATVQDPDGWTNVRKARSSQSDVVHKIYENEVFWYDYEQNDKEQNWIIVHIPINDYSLGTGESYLVNGFIHKSRLLPLETLKSYTKDDFSFRYALSDFDTTNRFVNRQDSKWITQIDGRPVWGADGGMPNTQVNDIDVKIAGKTLMIHKVFYSDIYECDNTFSIYKNGGTYFVHQWNSDGAGAYEIVWVFDAEGLKQRLVGTIH
jgi:hypothetical protein